MIITKHDGRLRLVRQDEHGVHAGGVTKLWGNSKFERTATHDSVTTAVGMHDIGWKIPDDEVLFNAETGSPINFINVNLRQHVDFYRSGFLKVLEQDPYGGLLVGMHWIGLYNSRFGYDPTFTYTIPQDLVAFMDSVVKGEQQNWVEIKERLWKKSGPRSEFEDVLWNQYELVQVMDRISLFMSMNDPEKKNEVVLGPVRTSQKGELVNLTVKSNGDGKLLVGPFPFASEFDANVPCKYIPDRVYESQDDLRHTLSNEKKEWVNWRIVAG